MTSDLSPCQIDISMQTVSGVGRWYKEDEGALSRRFVLEGIVDPSEDEWSKDDEATFGESKISVEIQAPRQEWLEEVATHEGLPSICGTLKVMANLQPERYTDDWFGPPVQASLFVDDQTFDRLEKHLADADRRDLEIGGRLDLSGNSLPKPQGAFVSVRRQELISNEDRIYAIVGFNLGAHGRRRFMPKRPLSPSTVVRHASPSTHLRVRLVDLRFSLDMERGQMSEIRCDGLIRAPNKPYNGAGVTVEFLEHDRDRSGDYPEEAEAGKFWLHPPEQNASPDRGYYGSIYLHFTEDDALKFLFPLLALGSGYGSLVLTLSMPIDDAFLDTASEPLSVAISRYCLELARNLGSDR